MISGYERNNILKAMTPTERTIIEESRHDDVKTDPDHPLILDTHGFFQDPFGIVILICSILVVVLIILAIVL